MFTEGIFKLAKTAMNAAETRNALYAAGWIPDFRGQYAEYEKGEQALVKAELELLDAAKNLSFSEKCFLDSYYKPFRVGKATSALTVKECIEDLCPNCYSNPCKGYGNSGAPC